MQDLNLMVFVFVLARYLHSRWSSFVFLLSVHNSDCVAFISCYCHGWLLFFNTKQDKIIKNKNFEIEAHLSSYSPCLHLLFTIPISPKSPT